MPYDLSVYGASFFPSNQFEGLRHAEWFMPLLMETFEPSRIVDVGCGTGHFLKWCFDHNVLAVGIEGAEWAALDNKIIPEVQIRHHDLRTPFTYAEGYFDKKFDLAICIEVAEHIEGEYADVFLDTLCGLSDTVVMTAAPPGQGGLQHVNEQPKDYWLEKMATRKYIYDVQTTIDLKHGIAEAVADGHHVATWFLPNILTFRRLEVKPRPTRYHDEYYK